MSQKKTSCAWNSTKTEKAHVFHPPEIPVQSFGSFQAQIFSCVETNLGPSNTQTRWVGRQLFFWQNPEKSGMRPFERVSRMSAICGPNRTDTRASKRVISGFWTHVPTSWERGGGSGRESSWFRLNWFELAMFLNFSVQSKKVNTSLNQLELATFLFWSFSVQVCLCSQISQIKQPQLHLWPQLQLMGTHLNTEKRNIYRNWWTPWPCTDWPPPPIDTWDTCHWPWYSWANTRLVSSPNQS